MRAHPPAKPARSLAAGGLVSRERPELRGEHVVLRPLAPDDAPALREIRVKPEVVAWWDRLEDDFPFSDDPEAARLTTDRDGEVVGLIQFGEEPEPMYRHAWIDIFVDPQGAAGHRRRRDRHPRPAPDDRSRPPPHHH